MTSLRTTRAIALLVLLSLPARADQTSADRDHADRLTAYLARRFDSAITAVHVDDRHIRIEGRAATASLILAEVPMWLDVTSAALTPVANPAPAADGRFTLTLDRRAPDGVDRLLSAWALVRPSGDKWELASAAHYADSVKPRADLPLMRPRSKKGLCGCPFDHPDTADLGAASATLNIVLNNLLHPDPARGRTPYPYAGRTWHVADAALARLDATLRKAAERDIMVSAIILLAPPRNSPANAWIRTAGHPDAEPAAAYVMPNFTTRDGTLAYAAAMNLLAERYSRQGSPFGRIHHYILHNEVNSGYHWTNAGPAKSMPTYLDLYQRSLRLTWLIARQYDPHARPLISLDHHWTINADKRGYPGRPMLERLADYSAAEGDFDWGIAYHPYAEDLFNPRAWADRRVTPTFDTPRITFKNVEVLDAWVRQPRMLYRGRDVRELQLSEQGLNARDYTDAAQLDQAAGLAYAWRKVAPLTSVTAFQYHRWMDARDEGGLRLGLRKFADEPGDPGGKKRAWDVFSALGTADEERAIEFAKPMIGIKGWDEVRTAVQAPQP